MDRHHDGREVRSLSETMEKYSHIQGATPREKVKNAYAQLRAKQHTPGSAQVPSASVTPTPSSAADIEYTAPDTKSDKVAPLSVRADKEPVSQASQSHEKQPLVSEPLVQSTLLESSGDPAIQTIQPSALAINPTVEPRPGSFQLGPSEYAIALPMDSRVKDAYVRVLMEGSNDVQAFINPDPNTNDNEHSQLAPKMHAVLERLNNITTHPDLNMARHIEGTESDLEKEASWAEYSSAKFLLLNYIFEYVGDSDMHFIIMVQGGKSQQILERYFLGKGFEYTKARETMGGGTNVEVSMRRASLSFGIRTTGESGILEAHERPSALIAFDATFNVKSPSVEHVRTTYSRNGKLLPVIHIFVSNSSEHVMRCFPGSSELERLRLLVGCTFHCRDVVGDLEDDGLAVHEYAEEILAFLLSENTTAVWPIPAIKPLRISGLNGQDFAPTQHSGDVNTRDSSIARSTQRLPVSLLKPFVCFLALIVNQTPEDASQPMPKRQKTSPSPQKVNEPMEFAAELTRTPGPGDLQTQEAKQARSSTYVGFNRPQKSATDSLQLLQEKDSSLGELQHRFESVAKIYHKTRIECIHLRESHAASEKRLEKQKEDITKLKDERTELKRELETSRNSLKAGGGTMAELESAREEIRRLSKENTSLVRKADYEKNQGEYTREQYQVASTAAAQLGNENRELREENDTLKRKVAGDVSRLKEITAKNDMGQHLSRIAELESMLAMRDNLLNRKEAELREIRRYRPSTRATSRSPRLNPSSRPSSPGIGRASQLRHSSESRAL